MFTKIIRTLLVTTMLLTASEGLRSTFPWSNAHTNSREVLAPQMSDNRPHPFVPPRASALPDAYLAQGEIEIVVDNEEVFCGEAVAAHKRRHRLPTQVHKRSGFG